MKRIPNAPHALVETRHRPAVQLPVLLTRRVPQQLCLFPNALNLHVFDAHGALSAVDVVCDDNGVLAGPWRDAAFNLRVARGEGGKRGLDKGVHPLGAAPPVAVVEVEALALQDKGADAILVEGVGSKNWGHGIESWGGKYAYLGLCDRFKSRDGHDGVAWRRLGTSLAHERLRSRNFGVVVTCSLPGEPGCRVASRKLLRDARHALPS